MNTEHTERVARVAAAVKEFYAKRKPFWVYHGSTNSTRILTFKRREMIDVSDLNHILAIDYNRRTAWVEPNVPMDQLVASLLREGFVPQVVPEFPGITVGGGVQGGAGESSSFRYGCFNQTCCRYEMILGNGEVVTASPDERADLFYGTAGSFGTLGIITAAEVKLLPATRYVNLTYLPVSSFEESVTKLTELVKQPYDFIDGLMFSAANGVIIVGELAEVRSGRVRRFSRAADPWYYLHAQRISRRAKQYCESVPIADYFFRYDRGGFWVGRYAFRLFGVPFNALTRWLLNPVMHTRRLYQALQVSGASQQYIVQDLALPADTAAAFMHFVDEQLGIYPLWLCPLLPDSKAPLQSNNLDTSVCVNVGVWGNHITDYRAFVRANRAIERAVAELNGKKWFYAHSYYTEREFWRLYDRSWYDALRQKYHAETLPNMYDKIRVHEVHPVHMKRGALQTIWHTASLHVSD